MLCHARWELVEIARKFVLVGVALLAVPAHGRALPRDLAQRVLDAVHGVAPRAPVPQRLPVEDDVPPVPARLHEARPVLGQPQPAFEAAAAPGCLPVSPLAVG